MFRATPLIGFMAGGGGAIIEHVYSADSIGGAPPNNKTWSGVQYGTPRGNSLLLIAAYTWSTGTQPTIGAITIDGNAATVHQSALATNSLSFDAACAFATGATGASSGTIVVNHNNGWSNTRIDVWRLQFLSSTTIFNSNKSTTIDGSACSLGLNVPPKGIAFAAFTTRNGSGTPAITGVTQIASGALGGVSFWAYGHDRLQPPATSRTITADDGAASGQALVAGSWS